MLWVRVVLGELMFG
ncbi:hypothetical protein, partial [Plasmodium yoelii yoelii]